MQSRTFNASVGKLFPKLKSRKLKSNQHTDSKTELKSQEKQLKMLL